MKKLISILILISATLAITIQANARGGKASDPGYAEIKDISYAQAGETDKYRLERCKLDIYYPKNQKDFATLVWFHGGGLEGGSKKMLNELRNQGFAVVNVNYRLYPDVKCPGYIEDAAMATAWVFKHIAEYGGDPSMIFVGGHSAGGYLTLMITLDKSYLAAYGIDADKIVKGYPVSGKTHTHQIINKERGFKGELTVIDEMAPVYHARKDGTPLMLITGARELEMLARYEENAHLYAILKHYGHPAELFELQGFNHGSVLAPACIKIRGDIRKLIK